MAQRAVLTVLLLFILPALLPGSPYAANPIVKIDRLDAVKPGWAVAESTGDGTQGSITVERAVWPLFYLHWMPRDAGSGDELSVKDAEAAVAALWPEIPPDGPLQGRRIELPAHPGVMIETLRGHAVVSSRYLVWLCPQTGRVIVADANLHLAASAPPELLELQTLMARTVRCHEGAKVEISGKAGRAFEVPESSLAFSHPDDWVPAANYRAVTTFGDPEWKQETPRNSTQKGQIVVLEADPMKRMFISWAPTPDYPMSFDVLKTRIEDHWRERAADLLMQNGSVANEFWFVDGMVRPGKFRRELPPTRLHKFRSWMWRRGSVTWFATADVGGVRFGRANIALNTDAWDLKLEEMFQAIDQP
ncbi:MAG: hypothetical protein ACREAA_00935 [Candidatus Polarisedimenticolia bacterium]